MDKIDLKKENNDKQTSTCAVQPNTERVNNISRSMLLKLLVSLYLIVWTQWLKYQ